MIVRTELVNDSLSEPMEGSFSASQVENQVDSRRETLLSPSIQATAGDCVPAYELKMVLPQSLARQLEDWAEVAMERDQFCEAHEGGAYETTTLYLDTPQLDVFHRSPGFRRRKYRLRRYGNESLVYLERKARRADRVRKRRSNVPLLELPRLFSDDPADGWAGQWFRDRIALRSLRPACRITYRRTAFVQSTAQGAIRLTFDRQVRGVVATDWDLSPVEQGVGVLHGDVICEFKFRDALPSLFKEVILGMQLEAGSMSKYRTVMAADGMLGAGSRKYA